MDGRIGRSADIHVRRGLFVSIATLILLLAHVVFGW
jgi:hypothetical protein